jgi:hypothetical protein|tara:strand:+ start:1474 stop:2226 length:753 start_codon:yes stop_codon:yes gene_type:complete
MESNLELVAPYKALLTSGCSWTDTRLTSNNWSRQLASDLEMIPLCKGMSGAGNQYIFESLVDSITSVKPETIGLVVAQWSQLDRYDVEGSEWMRFPLYAWPKKDRREFGYKREVFHDIISKSFNETTLEEMLYIWQRKQDRYSFALKQICKSLNIKLIEFQGTDKWCPVEHDLKLANKSLKFECEEWSWDKHLKDLEGSARDNPIYRVGYNQPSNWYVGYTGKLDFDWHPNELGHTVIKDILLKRFKDTK